MKIPTLCESTHAHLQSCSSIGKCEKMSNKPDKKNMLAKINRYNTILLFLQITKHYSKPGVEPVEVLPFYPDFTVSIKLHIHCN